MEFSISNGVTPEPLLPASYPNAKSQVSVLVFLLLFVCSFFIATTTNYHKLSGLRQHECIDLQFWMSDTQTGAARALFLLEALGENLFPCQLLETTCIPWHVAPSSIFKAGNMTSSSLSLTLTPLPFSYKEGFL